ncbi:MAG: hypothetical protein KGP27_17190 [Hyphomicrobiales bacterium]|nr:hypothetical protein [Hyphomicrobiales bacterium]
MPKFIAIFGTLMFVAGLTSYVIARMKRLDASWWATWAFLFPPLVLVIFFVPRNEGPRPRRLTIDEEEERDLRRDGSNSFL